MHVSFRGPKSRQGGFQKQYASNVPHFGGAASFGVSSDNDRITTGGTDALISLPGYSHDGFLDDFEERFFPSVVPPLPLPCVCQALKSHFHPEFVLEPSPVSSRITMFDPALPSPPVEPSNAAPAPSYETSGVAPVRHLPRSSSKFKASLIEDRRTSLLSAVEDSPLGRDITQPSSSSSDTISAAATAAALARSASVSLPCVRDVVALQSSLLLCLLSLAGLEGAECALVGIFVSLCGVLTSRAFSCDRMTLKNCSCKTKQDDEGQRGPIYTGGGGGTTVTTIPNMNEVHSAAIV